MRAGRESSPRKKVAKSIRRDPAQANSQSSTPVTCHVSSPPGPRGARRRRGGCRGDPNNAGGAHRAPHGRTGHEWGGSGERGRLRRAGAAEAAASSQRRGGPICSLRLPVVQSRRIGQHPVQSAVDCWPGGPRAAISARLELDSGQTWVVHPRIPLALTFRSGPGPVFAAQHYVQACWGKPGAAGCDPPVVIRRPCPAGRATCPRCHRALPRATPPRLVRAPHASCARPRPMRPTPPPTPPRPARPQPPRPRPPRPPLPRGGVP